MAKTLNKTVQKPVRFRSHEWRQVAKLARIVSKERRATVKPITLFHDLGMLAIEAELARREAPVQESVAA